MIDSVKWIAIIGAITAMVGKAYFLGQESIKHEWDKERAEFAIAQMQELAETQAALMKLEEVKHENLKTIDRLSADLKSVRVRLPVHKCASEDNLPNATSTGSNEVAGSGEFPGGLQVAFDDFTAAMAASAMKADLLVEDCRVLRDWAAGLQP